MYQSSHAHISYQVLHVIPVALPAWTAHLAGIVRPVTHNRHMHTASRQASKHSPAKLDPPQRHQPGAGLDPEPHVHATRELPQQQAGCSACRHKSELGTKAFDNPGTQAAAAAAARLPPVWHLSSTACFVSHDRAIHKRWLACPLVHGCSNTQDTRQACCAALAAPQLAGPIMAHT